MEYSPRLFLPGAQSHYLQGTNYGFDIPADATINGITVDINRYITSTSNGFDRVVQLLKNGTLTGDNLAALSTGWPNSEEIATYGGASNLWGATLTPADINNPNFGVALSVRNGSSSQSTITQMLIIWR